MSFIIDIILVMIIVIAVVVGWKKGFVRSIMNIISFFIALFGANYFYLSIAGFLKEKFFMDKISDFIEKTIFSNKYSIGELFTEKPKFFIDMLNKFSKASEVEAFYDTQTAKGVTDLTRKVSEYMADPIASTVSKVVAFIGLFIVFIIVLKIITIILDKIFKLPVLNTANKILGMIFGAFFGLLLSWMLSTLLVIILPKLSILYPEVFSKYTAENTVLLQLLYQFNPLSLLDFFRFK